MFTTTSSQSSYSARLIVPLLFFTLIIGSVSILQAAQVGFDNLARGPVVAKLETVALTPPARQFLNQRTADKAVVWVMFADKGVFTQSQFEQAAQELQLGERTLKRRAKMEADHIVFADLPVVTEYIDQVESLGGKLRRVSRWLNGASFEIETSSLDTVSGLPFVSSIRPVSFFTAPRPFIDEESKPLPDATALGTEDLNYGFSANQLTMLGVDKAHAAGYDGSGVLLGIFDSGYRKSHQAFASAYSEGRVISEYDFIFNDGNTANEPIDISIQWDHGTSVWGVAAGEVDGQLYGPAYKADFLLAKTEDLRSETPVEEDNWVAALEWADSLGVDIITTSLGYSDWYTYADFDGETAVITIAANTAVALGIVTINSAGNGGPAAGTITPPADAFEIISVGSVDALRNLVTSSSRGPTYDGRIKPEVCARGSGDWAPLSSGDLSYGLRSGTSFAAPLVAGCACILLQAHPAYTPQMIRQALMETADNADTPNNDYGWGIVNVDSALKWGVAFVADQTHGEPPLMVQFTDQSILNATSWHWDFGDGNESFDQSPSHTFDTAGVYDVTLEVTSPFGNQAITSVDMIVVSADSLTFGSDSAFAGSPMVSSVTLSNDIPLDEIEISFRTDTIGLDISLDSLKLGSRTSYFENLTTIYYGVPQKTYTARLKADNGGGALPLDPGSGEILRLFFSTDPWDDDQQSSVVDTTLVQAISTNLKIGLAEATPVITSGLLTTRDVVRGDLDIDGKRNLADITRLISAIYLGGEPPVVLQSGDCIIDHKLNLADITNLIAFVYLGGADPDLQ